MRLVGGTMYLVGAVMMLWNFLRTVRAPVIEAPPAPVPVAA
jgi:cbb3-type cytochrome oxidase subunit 1